MCNLPHQLVAQHGRDNDIDATKVQHNGRFIGKAEELARRRSGHALL